MFAPPRARRNPYRADRRAELARRRSGARTARSARPSGSSRPKNASGRDPEHPARFQRLLAQQRARTTSSGTPSLGLRPIGLRGRDSGRRGSAGPRCRWRGRPRAGSPSQASSGTASPRCSSSTTSPFRSRTRQLQVLGEVARAARPSKRTRSSRRSRAAACMSSTCISRPEPHDRDPVGHLLDLREHVPREDHRLARRARLRRPGRARPAGPRGRAPRSARRGSGSRPGRRTPAPGPASASCPSSRSGPCAAGRAS